MGAHAHAHEDIYYNLDFDWNHCWLLLDFMVLLEMGLEVNCINLFLNLPHKILIVNLDLH